jgi:hypothetical protein
MLKIMAFISFTTAAGIIAVMGNSDPESMSLQALARLFHSENFWTAVFLVSIILTAIDKMLFTSSVFVTLGFDYLEDRKAKKKLRSQGKEIKTADQL